MSSTLKLLTDISYGGTPYIDPPYADPLRLPFGNHEIIRFCFVKNKRYKPNAETFMTKYRLQVELKDYVVTLPEYFAVPLEDKYKRLNKLNSDGIKKFFSFGENHSKE